jgi:hypothetical protein
MWLYPGDFSRKFELIKELLLYFDGDVATLGAQWDLPDMRSEWTLSKCPWLAEALVKAGLLHFLDYHQVYGPDELYEGYAENVTAGLPPDEIVWGWYSARLEIIEAAMDGDSGALADYARGAITDKARLKRCSDGADIGLVHEVAGRYLDNGIQIVPVTDKNKMVNLYAACKSEWQGWRKALQVDRGDLYATSSNVVVQDLACVDLDLSKVPLSDILQFRQEFGKAFACYSSDVRNFALSLLHLPPEERTRSLAERRGELQDRRADLGRDARNRLELVLPGRFPSLLE